MACSNRCHLSIESTIAASGVRGWTEHYPAAHGWTFPARWCYDPMAAERAFKRVLALFDAEVTASASRRALPAGSQAE